MKFKINDCVIHKESLLPPYHTEAVTGYVLGYLSSFNREPLVVVRFEKVFGENKELFPINQLCPEEQLTLIEFLYSSMEDML